MKLERVWLWAGLILLAYFVAGALFLPRVGLTDDDDFYMPAGIAYADWLGDALRHPSQAFSEPAIREAFRPNHEHPPVAKYVFGITHAAFKGWLGEIGSARLGAWLFSTLAAGVMLALAIGYLGRRRGLWAGGLAVAFLALMPRFFFHSHAATLDVPVAAMLLLTTALALHGERRLWAGVAAGIAFGLATATKLNAPFLILPYLVFLGLSRFGGAARFEPKRPGSWRLWPMPTALLSMATLGPLTFFLVWPWMWIDPVNHVASYVRFHLHHYGIYFLYFGRIFHANPFAPWHAPFVMALLTVPVATSLLALWGLGSGLKRFFARDFGPNSGGDSPEKREGDLILMAGLQALTSILVVALFSGPKYGGEKLFMPFFPFWCLLAGYGALRWVEAAKAGLPKKLAYGLVGLALTSSLVFQARYGEYALSAYNALGGGLRGATALGMERQYYDIAFHETRRWLNDNAPKNARIHFAPNGWEYERTYRWYRKDALFRADLQLTKSEPEADLVVLSHERRFRIYPEVLARIARRPLRFEKRVDATPVWSIFGRK